MEDNLKKASFLATSILLLAILLLSSLSIGPYKGIGLMEALRVLVHGGMGRGVAEYRLTRTIAALVLGSGLGASGLAMQYALRNPLADPFLLGVSSGAAFGVVLAYALNPHPEPLLIYLLALAMGGVAFLTVLAIAWRTSLSPTSLIVAGVSVSYTLMGPTIILLYKVVQTSQPFLWLFGTVAYTPRTLLTATTLVVLTSIIVLAIVSEQAYTLILGDEVSESLGVKVARLRVIMLTASSAAASALVAMAGPVGFIGLAAPWISRLALGASYGTVLASAVIVGADLGLASDIVVRILGGPTELPLAAVTALFGGPILFYLTRRSGW